MVHTEQSDKVKFKLGVPTHAFTLLMIKDELVDLNSGQSEDEDVLRFSLVLDIAGFDHLERHF